MYDYALPKMVMLVMAYEMSELFNLIKPDIMYRYSAVEVSSSNCRRTERAALVSLTDGERACAQLARRREEGGRSAGREKGRGRVLAAQLAGIREEGGAGGRCWMLRSRCCHFDHFHILKRRETEMRKNENKYT